MTPGVGNSRDPHPPESGNYHDPRQPSGLNYAPCVFPAPSPGSKGLPARDRSRVPGAAHSNSGKIQQRMTRKWTLSGYIFDRETGSIQYHGRPSESDPPTRRRPRSRDRRRPAYGPTFRSRIIQPASQRIMEQAARITDHPDRTGQKSSRSVIIASTQSRMAGPKAAYSINSTTSLKTNKTGSGTRESKIRSPTRH